MSGAKDLSVAPISRRAADIVIKAFHYSGKVCANSQLNLGVFLNGRLEGAMQFGPSMDKRKVIGLVEGTKWNGFIELNRMAFSERLPKNSESRALGVAFRLIKKHYPHIDWVISFADGTQSGDGTIYRASGFVLTQIKRNSTILELPGGEKVADLSLRPSCMGKEREQYYKEKYGIEFHGSAGIKEFLKKGAHLLPGFQLRYIKFLNPEAEKRLTCQILPFSKIDEMGAGMYRGKARKAHEAGDGGDQPHSGSATLTRALQNKS